jgi:hypothetical protein
MDSNNTEHHATFSTHFKPTEKENSIQSNNKEKGGLGPLFLCSLNQMPNHIERTFAKSISVSILFERTVQIHADIIRLLLG